MTQKKIVQVRRVRRQNRVRSGITGTAETPRLSVFRSSMHIYAQLIDDVNGVTLASASSNDKAVRAEVPYGGNVAAARVVGQKLAAAAASKGITKASFDRGYYRFHGRVQALAEAATAAGLKCSGELKQKKVRVEKEAPKAKAKGGGGGGDKKKK